jgi:hypothetical protein
LVSFTAVLKGDRDVMATDNPIDELMARVRRRLRTSDLIEPDFKARDEDVGRLLDVVEHLRGREEDARQIIADGVMHMDALEAEDERPEGNEAR